MDLRFPKLNSLIVSGRLTRDSELKYTPNGSAVLRCSIAIDDGYWDKQANQWVDQTVFMDSNVWGPQAERLSNTLKKGSPVIIEGRLKQHAYTSPEGQNKRFTDIHIDKIQSLETTNKADNNGYNAGGGANTNNGYANNNGNNSNQQNNYNQNNNEKPQTSRPEPDFINDDVPF